ncbi:FimV/HubP family polar landmark protein [Caballeronia sp. TF1N1]|uniref:FimV/HubP family polar landmark protein n=1 Tax=Caballeronia sp. TF1N1 TaxID=2878153 RepID=UPI001FD1273E|nr:FimV/HubP family polar landmark protein [Caballeronia sp. TF1N1]
MIHRPGRSFNTPSRAAFAAAGIVASAVLAAHPGAAFAQASEVAAGATQQYAVKPGQSLSDIAGELTGSKERAVKEKMARALFEANPNAFAGHDINRLKLGSVLNVPATDAGGASAPVSVPASTPAPVPQENATAGASATGVAPASATQSAASEPAPPEAASNPALVASAPNAVAPASEASSTMAPAKPEFATSAAAPATGSPLSDPRIFLGGLVGLSVIFGQWYIRRRNRAKLEAARAAADPRAPRTFSSMEEAEADAAARNEKLRQQRERERLAAIAVASVDGKAVQRDDQSELNAVAASIEDYDAAQVFPTPSDDDAVARMTPSARNPASQAEPFVPATPAALHAEFVPSAREESSNDADAHETHAREIAARQAAALEARKWEEQEREAAARQAAHQEAEERETRARELAAREALARDLSARETQLREAEARDASEHAEHAREAAAREIIAREAELREAQARAAAEEAAEQRAAEQREIEHAALDVPPEPELDDDPSPGHRFPMPKFPKEAIQALDSLELGLPPRLELTLNTPHDLASSPPQALEAAPRESADAAPLPFIPQPVAHAQTAHEDLPPVPRGDSVVAQIEAGTAGAAAVAGLGATQYGPLSLDFDLNLPASQTAPLPALTPSQLATIARNKLELATEYIELGDLSGARTLLQEVLASNDSATRPQAAALLSTLAPHS